MECESRHCFHARCGSEWLKVRPTCPLCRRDFRQQILDLNVDNVKELEVPDEEDEEEEVVEEEEGEEEEEMKRNELSANENV